MKHVESLKKKVFNRSSSSIRTEQETPIVNNHGNGRPSLAVEPREPRTEHQYGLFAFETGSFDLKASGQERFPIDIIAVHGLGGDAYKTWTHGSTGKLWLRDFLPSFLPGCRVYTFGYPSKLNDTNMHAGVSEFGRKLLSSIRDHIEDSSEVHRGSTI